MNPSLPPPLHELQSWMRRRLTLSSEPVPHELAQWIIDDKVSREQRLAIYGEGYFWRLIDCLRSDFPALCRAWGDEAFVEWVRRYLLEHPSRSFNVTNVGARLPQYLRRQTGIPPYLADLAELERCVHCAFFAEDLPPLDREALATVAEDAWPAVRFSLDASVHIVESAWTIDEAWHQRDWDCETIRQNVTPTAQWLLVYRRDFEPYVQDIGQAAALLLRGMREGKTLGVLSEEVPLACGLSVEEGQAVFGSRFAEWIENGVIREILL